MAVTRPTRRVPVPDPDDLIPLEKAAARLGVPRAAMWRLAKQWNLAVYENPLDRRQKLYSWAAIEEARRPRRAQQAE
jgi:hypothetical protein